MVRCGRASCGKRFPESSRFPWFPSSGTCCSSSSSCRSGACSCPSRASTEVTGRSRSAKRCGPRRAWPSAGRRILVLLIFGLRFDFVSRWFLVLFGFLNFVLLAMEKVALRLLSRGVRARGFNFRTALIVGTGPQAAQFGDFLEGHPHWGFRVVGYLDDDNGERDRPEGELALPRTHHGHRIGSGRGGDRRGHLRDRERQARRIRAGPARRRAPRGAGARLPRHLPARPRAARARGARRDSAALLHDDAFEPDRARRQARRSISSCRWCSSWSRSRSRSSRRPRSVSPPEGRSSSDRSAAG